MSIIAGCVKSDIRCYGVFERRGDPLLYISSFAESQSTPGVRACFNVYGSQWKPCFYEGLAELRIWTRGPHTAGTRQLRGLAPPGSRVCLLICTIIAFTPPS